MNGLSKLTDAERIAQLEDELAVARSFQSNYEHATKIDREDAAEQLAAAEKLAEERLELLRKAAIEMDQAYQSNQFSFQFELLLAQIRAALGKEPE